VTGAQTEWYAALRYAQASGARAIASQKAVLEVNPGGTSEVHTGTRSLGIKP